MNIRKLLIANRGEIAVRISRAAAELGIETVSIYSEDDDTSLHTRRADHAVPISGRGAAAYLDIDQIVAAAKGAGCDAVHPGYGFLSENAAFARRCSEEGLCFIGPDPHVLDLFGDKAQARALAEQLGIAVLPGTRSPAKLDEVKAFFKSLGDDAHIMIKAVSGGGGRGMRSVHSLENIEKEYARCASEARSAFGSTDVYAEEFLNRARHIEVQIVGDGAGGVSHLWERECSLQRRHQKLVEITPSPSLTTTLREKMFDAAVRLAQAVNYRGLGTFEFLVDADGSGDHNRFAFMEVNPRLQVEHTVTEEVTGLDLVKIQLCLAEGSSLKSLGLSQSEIPEPGGYAIQLRINMEVLGAGGEVIPSIGRIEAFEPPSGPGLRVDTFGYAGYAASPDFDSLLAKLIAYSGSADYADAVRKAYRALCEFRVDGVETNIGLLQNLMNMPDVAANKVYTRFIEDNIASLTAASEDNHRKLFFEQSFGTAPGAAAALPVMAPPGTVAVPSVMAGSVIGVEVAEGEIVLAGQALIYLEAMKMEHQVSAVTGGIVRLVAVKPGDTVTTGQALVFIEPQDIETLAAEAEETLDLDNVRTDLAEVLTRHEATMDAARPAAVEKRRKTGQRTARENVEDLLDPGSFIEYGALALAGQRRRLSVPDLIKVSPADGLIAGVGSVNGGLFDEDKARTMVLAYDFTVFAGTQGGMNHKKIDRMLHLAKQWSLPIVLFAEGGGGRPSDTDINWVAGLDLASFHSFACMSGLAPLVGIVSGRCFAGNAALLGCSDVIIATEYSNIGMGGPAMIEGGGLGVCSPDDIGPISVQAPNGVVDIRVADEAEAVSAAKKYLSYFQGTLQDWSCDDQRKLRSLIPENRKRAYDIRTVIESMADTGSVLELRKEFGIGFVTALIRIEGRPMGLVANNPWHLGGAIDADAADKAARFMQLCDAYDLPIVSLCDTPGFMVGPEVEKTALVRHISRLYVVASSMSVPLFTVVLRKGYGLGAMSVAGGYFHAPFFTVSWPTGEFGGMGLEGAVRLAMRRELAAIEDPDEREKTFQAAVAMSYEHGKSINMASYLEIDGVIDPMETRRWIMQGLKSVPKPEKVKGKKRPFIDTW
jgi:acetyl/propionyl-CoA carboxylase alpha subunit/acetyl-CoA carboxylase carboxyltransferase component